MKLERFKYHEKFCVKSTFLDTAIDVEGTLDEGETLEEGVAKAREEMLKAIQPQMKANLDAGWGKGIHNPPVGEVSYTKESILPPVIDYGKHDASPEGVLADIKRCETLEELLTFKRIASADQTKELYTAYCQKLKELTPNNFTEGLG